MTWPLPKLHNLTKNGSSGFTMAMPQATAMDLCRHNRMFGVIITIPGVSHVAMIHSSSCPLTRTATRLEPELVYLASGGPTRCR